MWVHFSTELIITYKFEILNRNVSTQGRFYLTADPAATGGLAPGGASRVGVFLLYKIKYVGFESKMGFQIIKK